MFSVWCHSRLPSETELEAASRGKVGNLDLNEHWRYGFEGGEYILPQYASSDPVAVGVHWPTTRHELYDMHGLSWGWCSNSGGEENSHSSDPKRVLRGGARADEYGLITSCSAFLCLDADDSNFMAGCRVARSRFK